MAQVWEVVGGADKGGIIVKEGESPGSDKIDDRLSTGALVEEVELKGERLSYKLLSGKGPEVGWVSTKIPGKDLLVKTDKRPDAAEDDDAPAAAEDDDAAALDTEPGVGGTNNIDHHPPAVQEMIRARCEKELQKPPYEWQWISNEVVLNGHDKKAPGVMYGLEFPWNEQTLTEFGPEWLTKAMHTAGTMAADNKVTKIILEKKIKVTTGNNGGKFLFEVEYAKADPDLHTKLFAKIPHALEGVTKNDRISSSVNKQPAELYEINAYRYLEAVLPMKTPRFYFGDISNATSNWLIVTERIAFHDFDGNNFGKPGKMPKPLPAFEIEGPYDKCIDYNLRGKPEEYYMLMTRVGARMAGLAKAGKLGSQELLAKSFRAAQDPTNMMAWGMNPGGCTGEMPKQVKMKLDMACNFISDTGKVIFPKYMHSQDKFLAKFRAVMMKVNAYSAELNYWMHQNPDITALGHMNLNVDNAYFWRDEQGRLDCGVFDWGGMGTSSYGSKLWWWYYCMDFDVFRKQLPRLLECFAKEYEASGGPKVDPKEMEPMVIIAAIQQMAGLVSAVPQIIKMCPKKEWPTIKDRYDPRIALNVDGKSTIRLYLHCMCSIMRIIEEMKGDQVFDTWVKDVYVGKFKQTPKTDAMINGA